MAKQGWDLYRVMVYTVHFQARKSGQSQREEKHLETESYGSKHGMDGRGERGGSKAGEKTLSPVR